MVIIGLAHMRGGIEEPDGLVVHHVQAGPPPLHNPESASIRHTVTFYLKKTTDMIRTLRNT